MKSTWRGLGFASVEDFTARFWEAFWLPKDACDVVVQARKARAADASSGGDLAKALSQITARAFVIAFIGDPMFRPEDCRIDAKSIPDGHYREIESALGHLATFALTEQDKHAVDSVLKEVLAE